MAALSDERNEIADGTLLLIASTSILKPQRLSQANEKWEDLTKDTQTWEAWKVLYKDAQVKARIKKAQSRETSLVQPMRPASERQSAQTGEMQHHTARQKKIRWRHDGNVGFFDNLEAAAPNYKAVLAQLADNNTNLVNTNEELAEKFKRLTNETKQLQQEINTIRRQGDETLAAAAMQQGAWELVGTLPIVNGRYIMRQTLVTSWKRMPADGRRAGVVACDEVGLLV